MDPTQVNLFDINKVNTDFLEEKRKHTDIIADTVIAKIISSGNEKKINDVFLKLVSNDSYHPDLFKDLPYEVSAPVIEYFSNTSHLPSWADQRKLKTGEEVFSLFGPEIFLLLNVLSLPMCYTCSKGAKVLYMTGRLSERGGNIDPMARRLMETAQMVVNAMSPGGMSPQGKGIITIQKVRLIHASIRYFLKHEKFNPKGWDVDYYGEPINQEDLAGTLMSFAPMILNGLKNLEVGITKEQKEAYIHCWKVTGYLMGIDHDLLPDTEEEAWELAVRILKHQSAKSEEGIELTNSCITFIDTVMPGTIFNGVSEYMMWYFFQDMSEDTEKDLSAMIGIKPKDGMKEYIALAIGRFIGKEISHLEEDSAIIGKISGFFNRLLLHGYLKHYNGGKNIHFFIPPSLQKDWKLTSEWEDKFPVTPNILGNRLILQQKKDEFKH